MVGRRTPAGKIVLQPGVSAADAERQLILDTLRRTRNNKAEAARQLGLDVKTIRNKLKTWGMPSSHAAALGDRPKGVLVERTRDERRETKDERRRDERRETETNCE